MPSSLDGFIAQVDLDNSLLVGYYGGGNFGDELLLEILLNRLDYHQPSSRLNVYYLHPEWYKDFHKDYGHSILGIKQLAAIKAFLNSKSIVVGGGGLWGLDFNSKVMFMSLMLFIGRFIFRKKVYLLGVGFYNSTNFFGRIGAWFAAKSAQDIYARDQESFQNFSKYSARTVLSEDFSALLSLIGSDEYKQEMNTVKESLPVVSNSLFICIRNFKGDLNRTFQNVIKQVVLANQDKKIILAIMEPKEINPGGFAFLNSLAKEKNIMAMDFRFNPVAFYFYLKSVGSHLTMIAPHYHAQVVALKSNIRFMPIVYDNKSAQLLKKSKVAEIHDIASLRAEGIQAFIDNTRGS